MENNLVKHLARRAAEDSCISLRFNYRGVGDSTIHLPESLSVFDYWAELERERSYDVLVPDVISANDFLTSAVPDGVTRVILGYSLGAVLAGMASRRLSADRLVAIAPPTARVGLDGYCDCSAAKWFITGKEDFAYDEHRFLIEYNALLDPKYHIKLSDCDHFFRKMEERVFGVCKPALSHQE